MPETRDVTLFYTDGWVHSRKRVLIAAKLNTLPDKYFSRCLIVDTGNESEEWGCWDIADAVHSVTIDPQTDEILWLGQSGTITVTGDAPRRVELIKDAERLGNMNRVRAIAGAVYACGYGGQVYVRSPLQWVHMDSDILVPNPDARSLDLLDIDGTARDDLVAVGTNGTVLHFDGNRWKSLQCPTNVHLTRVKCVDRGEFYVCGFRGALFQGNLKHWKDLGNEDVTEHLYGLEMFKGIVYVARSSGLLHLSGERLLPVRIDVDGAFSFHRLHANDGQMWSFGADDLLRFDGVAWSRVTNPENEG